MSSVRGLKQKIRDGEVVVALRPSITIGRGELEAALAKPGVDYVAFGPSDLSFDLESHPEYRFRTTDDCTRYVAEQLAGTGLRLGMAIVTEPEERGKYLEMGLTVFQETPRR